MNDIWLSHLHDLSRRGGAGSFLTPAQAAQAQRVFGHALTLLGGFQTAERAIPVFGDTAHPERFLAAIRLRFRPQDTLSHRDILGAVLGLGLERSVLGDIFVREGEAYLVCLRRTADFICENLTMAGRVGLQVSAIPLEELPEPERNIEELRCTVASLRLDALLSQAFHISRGKAEELLRLGLVQLAGEECRSGAKQVRQGDIFSARGHGRAQLMEVSGKSKKDRLWVVIGIYV